MSFEMTYSDPFLDGIYPVTENEIREALIINGCGPDDVDNAIGMLKSGAFQVCGKYVYRWID